MKKAVVLWGIGILAGCMLTGCGFQSAEKAVEVPKESVDHVLQSSEKDQALSQNQALLSLAESAAPTEQIDGADHDQADLSQEGPEQVNRSNPIGEQEKNRESVEETDRENPLEEAEKGENTDHQKAEQKVEQQEPVSEAEESDKGPVQDHAAEEAVEEEIKLDPEPVNVEESPVQEDQVQEVQTVSLEPSFSDLFIRDRIEVKKEPVTSKEFEAVLLQMCATNSFEYTIVYQDIGFYELLTDATKAAIAQAFDSVFYRYPEYMSFTNHMSYKAKGGEDQVTLTLILSSDTGMSALDITAHRQAFFEESRFIVEGLVETGHLYEGQSDQDKAKVLFDWVVQQAEYDYDFYPESYTGYGIFENGLGVCQGYTAAYNALCKSAGLWVEGVGGRADGAEHIWTKALFAGEDVYIDATWGDSYINSDKSNYDFFMVDGMSLSATHSWQ